MASTSNHLRKLAVVLSHARGADILSNEETFRLQERTRTRKNKKLHFLTSEDRWMPRQVVREHLVKRYNKQFCGLCGINSGNTKKLRPLPNPECATCFVNHCTVLNKHEKVLLCFQAWHEEDTLNTRTYYAQTAHRGTLTDSDSEESMEAQRTLSQPPRQPPRTPWPSPKPQPRPLQRIPSPFTTPRRHRTQTRRRVSISPSSSEERRHRRQRTDSPGVNRFREQIAE